MRYPTYELKLRNFKNWDILNMSSNWEIARNEISYMWAQIEKLLEMRYPTYELKLRNCKKWDILHMSSNWEIVRNEISYISNWEIARNEISYMWAQIEKLLEMRYPTCELKLRNCKKWDILNMSSNWEIVRNEILYIMNRKFKQ
jgi:uncharacterized protein YgiM (DUF1202 family)